MRRSRSLAGQVLAVQLVVVALTVALAGAVALWETRARVTDRESDRMLALARSVAATPSVREALAGPDPARTLQPLALAVSAAGDATYVVIADEDQVRVAHPDPALIGGKLSTDATETLAGRDVVTLETGTLGRTIRAKAPVYDSGGQVIGVVSVGIEADRVGQQLRARLPTLLGLLGLATVLGSLGAWLLARRVKRDTFGLEPAEIGRLLVQREATLRGVREGVVVLDAAGVVTLANDEAVRLLGLDGDPVGATVEGLGLPERLTEVLSGVAAGEDLVVLRAGRVLALNRRPVTVDGGEAGAVVTLRDRTELDTLTSALDGARTTTDALRAQAHEFSNRMHTVAGLIELGENDEALAYIEAGAPGREHLARALAGQVHEPALAALLLAKASWAAEHGVDLRLTDRSHLPADSGVHPDALVTVVGNLVANAVEALSPDAAGGWVEVDVRDTAAGVLLTVRDSGPGVAAELVEEVFSHGFSTKVAQEGGVRGLGLALARQACRTRGGWIEVDPGEGSVFRALLPHERVPA